jgi:hypothetical protein
MTTPPPSKVRRIVAWAFTGLVGLGLIASAAMKLSGPAQVVENFEKFHLAPYRTGIGLLELLVGVLFVVPRTQSLGTLLVTGYFGGAVVAHLVVDAPGQAVAPLTLGALAWAANYLRRPSMFDSFRS